MLNTDTDRTQAIRIENLSHRWLKWLDKKVGVLKAENGCHFGLSVIFRGEDQPYETAITGTYHSKQIFKSRG